MTDRFKEALDFIDAQSYKPEHKQKSISEEIEILRELATEAEQLRKRIATLETFIESRGYDVP